MKRQVKIPAARRRELISQKLADSQSVSIPELAASFGVSEMTVRRDLDSLEAIGKVHRTHGGATMAERMAFEFNFVARRQANRRAKQAIAREALKLIKSGMRIIIDTGTTSLELAHLLRHFDSAGQLTVITPSLAVASELQFCENIQTILLGGIVRKGSPDLTGIVAESVLDMFFADVAFQGADAIDLDGAMYNADTRTAEVDRKIRSRADSTYILADSSKIGRTELTRHGFVQETAGLITDDALDDEKRRRLEKLGTKVTTIRAKN
ncbi:MAG TPA: DeoR/GlpR family DNA-binding transcription regulator [Phycisphaerae bacterium]|nr:DeoR/GlpR family DNA-binding transcription regulator [Phycisphaerae bacterium]